MPSRIDPVPREDLAEHDGLFTAYEQIMGFVPQTVLTMARVPGLMESHASTALAAAMNGLITPELAQMCGHLSSAAAGCRYCQAHTIAHAEHLGIHPDKLADLWTYQTSNHFTDAERAALTLAFHTGQHPNAVTDTHIDNCRTHYTDDQITAIVAVCSLFGFLNRWNDTLATTLEPTPTAAAGRHLGEQGWTPGKHATDTQENEQ
ncbi:MAG: carboxymuconolactone decarboxylase family protein [Acidimicrobiales bacterium]|nr:carboxymuconolactone decarboxylase family protein [Acidimicrobiales bacterium]